MKRAFTNLIQTVEATFKRYKNTQAQQRPHLTQYWPTNDRFHTAGAIAVTFFTTYLSGHVNSAVSSVVCRKGQRFFAFPMTRRQTRTGWQIEKTPQRDIMGKRGIWFICKRTLPSCTISLNQILLSTIKSLEMANNSGKQILPNSCACEMANLCVAHTCASSHVVYITRCRESSGLMRGGNRVGRLIGFREMFEHFLVYASWLWLPLAVIYSIDWENELENSVNTFPRSTDLNLISSWTENSENSLKEISCKRCYPSLMRAHGHVCLYSRSEAIERG